MRSVDTVIAIISRETAQRETGQSNASLWGWKAQLALLADLQRTVYPYKWLLISCRSGADQWKFADQRPTFYHWATKPTTCEWQVPGWSTAHACSSFISSNKRKLLHIQLPFYCVLTTSPHKLLCTHKSHLMTTRSKVRGQNQQQMTVQQTHNSKLMIASEKLGHAGKEMGHAGK